MTSRLHACVLLAGLVLAAGGVSRADTPPATHHYAGTQKCKMCHINEWKSWTETRMAKAFDLLRPGERADAKKAHGLDPTKDYTSDPTCIGCHTTGHGEPGGFVDPQSTPHQVGVGCEACHGDGENYIKDPYMSLKNKEYKKADVVAAGLVAPVTRERCLACHNNKSPFVGKDYVFDFEAKKEKGTHQKFPLKYQH